VLGRDRRAEKVERGGPGCGRSRGAGGEFDLAAQPTGGGGIKELVIMAKNDSVLSDKELGGLFGGMVDSRKKLEPFRKHRLDVLAQYGGPNYGANNIDKIPINLLLLGFSVYRRILAPRRLECSMSTEKPNLRSFAQTFELDVNHALKEMAFEKTIRMAVLEALVCFGAVKIGVNPVEIDLANGATHNKGEAFCDPVNLDHWCHDMNAETWEQVSFMANRYRLRADLAKEWSGFDKAAREKLVPVAMGAGNEFNSSTDLAKDLGSGQGGSDEGLYDYVELWDVFLPQENILITMPADGSWERGKVLKQEQWVGPEGGPYRWMTFLDMPGNTMPLAPSMDWIDSHNLNNTLLRKLARQATRQKTLMMYARAATSDARLAQQASDGEAVASDNPGASREVSFGGIHAGNFSFLSFLKELFVYKGGNLDQLAGLGAQTATVGQETLVNQGANAIAEEMKDRTVEFVAQCMRDVALWEWNDPQVNRELMKTMPGAPEVQIPVRFSYDKKEGDFLDYNLTLSPYSVASKSPTQELAALGQIWQQYVAPLLPIMMQQGKMLDVDALLRQLGKKYGISDLDEIFPFIQAAQPANKEVVGGTSTLSNQPRRYIRENVSTRTNKGTANAMMAALPGKGNQNKMLGE
jgi:hypothetical protein